MSDKEIKDVISKYLKIRVRTHKDVIEHTGIPETTYFRRMANPQTFQVRELRLIFDYLKIPQAERNI